MKLKAFALSVSAFLLLSGWVGAVSEKDFEAQTTLQLLNPCKAAPADPLNQRAFNFCHGYLVGAYKYYEVADLEPGRPKFVCLPKE